MKSKILKPLAEIIVLIIVTALVGWAAFSFGYSAGRETPQNIKITGVTNILDAEVRADFDVFWQTWKLVRDEYIDGQNLDEVDLVHGAAMGMVNALKDPNTIFFPPSDAKKFEEDVRGVFGGIGAEIGARDGGIIVVAPLKNTPAERAGLKNGDHIIAVDGESTGGLNVLEAVKIIRGPVGSLVTLTTFRDGWERPRDIDITREVIQIPTLESEMLPDGILHLQLFSFNENASLAFYESILKAADAGANSIILDLRNDPGGFLEVAVNLAGWFLDRGSVVVTEEFRSGDMRVFRAQGNEVLKNIPVVVLVNNGSASASEILAGALRDQRGIKLIGEKTFGKGSVQELKELKDGSSLKLTVARWLLPSGAVIEKNGLAPDIEVALTDEDVEAGQDPQLERAIAILRAELNL